LRASRTAFFTASSVYSRISATAVAVICRLQVRTNASFAVGPGTRNSRLLDPEGGSQNATLVVVLLVLVVVLVVISSLKIPKAFLTSLPSHILKLISNR